MKDAVGVCPQCGPVKLKSHPLKGEIHWCCSTCGLTLEVEYYDLDDLKQEALGGE